MHLLPAKGADVGSHPTIRNANDVADERLSVTERFCQRIAAATGAPITLVAVIVFQLVWIVVGHVTKMDPYPFVFMLTVSNVIQLVLIVVLAVGGKQQSTHDQIRAEQDHAALSRLLYHQQAQERILLELAQKSGIDTTEAERTIADLLASPQEPRTGNAQGASHA